MMKYFFSYFDEKRTEMLSDSVIADQEVCGVLLRQSNLRV